ncbi:uncharacterized protein LOC127007387 isoform X2 [Eriocheir sinensis]|uniref:uncharacterized protein LOC127007387 isoform X2 n=2 Tax=Eriocheir sinensis TaxID=95602 RepID=UPI0021C598C4|nr:uncharacterized protein LOC127007387 isoform X2 [Eriocheir sinensis]
MKFKMGFLASVPLATDTEVVATTVRYRQSGEWLGRVGSEREPSRACRHTEAGEDCEEDDPRTRPCLPPHPTARTVCASFHHHKASLPPDDDASLSRGRSSSTSSSESFNTNSVDSISYNSTNSSGSTLSTGNSFGSRNAHDNDNGSVCVKTKNSSRKKMFSLGRKCDLRKRRFGPDTANVQHLTPHGLTGASVTTATASLNFSVRGKPDAGRHVMKEVNHKTNSLSSNSSYESQTSSTSSTKSFTNFFSRGNVFSSSFKIRSKCKKMCNNSSNNSGGSSTATTTTTTISSSSNSNITSSINSTITENSRFLLPADSVTNIVVVGDKGVGKSAITVRFLTRRYIGEYSSDAEMMYQHDTLVDHAPACLQLLDATTVQTPHQILSHLSWAHAFVVVYDVTSRTSFTHAKKLLHIIHSCSHTPLHLPFSFSSNACSCRASNIPLRWDMLHGRPRNVSVCTNSEETVNGYEDADTETTSPSLYFIRGASRTPHSHNQPQIANHQVYTCYDVEPPPNGYSSFTSSSLPVSTTGGRDHVGDGWHRTRRPTTGGPHQAVSPAYDSPRGSNRHCPCHGHHNTLRSSTTPNNCVNNYNKATIFPSHVYCDSPVTDHASYDDGGGKKWSLSETVRRTPLHDGRSFEPCDGRQKYECIYERYTKGSSLHHSCNQLLPDHATLNHQNGVPARGCTPTSPQRRHTTLLLGNKRDLEHIRRVWTDEGEALSLQFSCQFYEVSAAESLLGVHLAFHSLLKEARALQLIRSLPHTSPKATVSSAVSKVIGNFFRVGKVGPKRQSNSI